MSGTVNRISSKTVAELLGKRHDNLMRTIRTDLKHLEEPDKFYLDSSYTDGKGKKRESFEISYEGCERLAKKLTADEKEDFLTAVSLRLGKAVKTPNTEPQEVSEKEYSIKEAAEVLGVSERTIRRRIESGELKAEKREFRQVIVSERSVITEAALEEYKGRLRGDESV